MALELRHLVSPAKRLGGFGGRQGGEGDDLGVAQHLVRERLDEAAGASGVLARDEPGALLDLAAGPEVVAGRLHLLTPRRPCCAQLVGHPEDLGAPVVVHC